MLIAPLHLVDLGTPDRLLAGASVPASHDWSDRLADKLQNRRLLALLEGMGRSRPSTPGPEPPTHLAA